MKILVTGGGGFLGTYICKELQKYNHDVINFSRHRYNHLETMNIRTIKGDVSDKESIKNALEGIEAIFHVAALAGVWGNPKSFNSINTQGTINLVEAAKDHGIKYLIYTSTPSVVFSKDNIENGNESLPYPKKYLTDYACSKSKAENFVLENCNDIFHAIAIRPHLIWGPGDPHIIPRLIRKAKEGKLKQVGEGNNLVDVIYVENAARAHVQAFEKLRLDHAISGNAYFIGQERPVNLWDFINQILTMAKVDVVEDKISFKLAYTIGALLEALFKIFGIYKPEPPMTRFVACQLAKSHYFNHAKAKKDFGYEPEISIEEGLKRTFQQKAEISQLLENKNIESP